MGAWLVVPLYWAVLLAACRRKKSYGLFFRFLEGFFLSFVCFCFFPMVFLKGVFLAGGGAIFGILLGVFLESKGSFGTKEKRGALLFLFVFFVYEVPVGLPILVQGMVGGLGLYNASSGLMPQGNTMEELLPTAIGGVLGFLLGAWICIF